MKLTKKVLKEMIKRELKEFRLKGMKSGADEGHNSDTNVDLLSRVSDLLEIAEYIEKNHGSYKPKKLTTAIFRLFDDTVKVD